MKIKPAILREALKSGETPVLLYDFEAIEGNYKRFRTLTTLHQATWSLAVKALAQSDLIELSSPYVDGYDISNLNEWELIKDYVKPNHKVWLTNGNLLRELKEIATKVSVNQLYVTINDLEDFKIALKENVSYLVRVSTSELSTQKGQSRFGLSLSQIKSIKEQILKDKNFKGFHLHQGLENNSYTILKPILDGIKTSLSDFKECDLVFNIGGGLQTFTDEEIGSCLKAITGFKLHIEPGRACYINAGYALAPIEKFFMEGDLLRIFTRLSIIGHLKWSRPNLAGILNMNENIETLSPARLVIEGPTCYEFDKSEDMPVVTDISLAIGSLVILDHISGYSSEWNTAFNGVPKCEIKFVGRRRRDNP